MSPSLRRGLSDAKPDSVANCEPVCKPYSVTNKFPNHQSFCQPHNIANCQPNRKSHNIANVSPDNQSL